MKSLFDKLYVIWIIGSKDILDALKNKSSRTNILVMSAMVVFFYWFGTARPFDKDVSVVVYAEGQTQLSLDRVNLDSGSQYDFRSAATLPEMVEKMAHQSVGIVLPSNFDESFSAGEAPVLQGYIFWVDRMKVDELEDQYTRDISEILGRPVVVAIGDNIVIPDASAIGMHTTLSHQLIYFIFWTSLALIPFLMLEEKDSRTMDALLVSPAGSGEVVLGKALAGFFYVLVVGGLALALNWMYIVNWGMAVVSFLGYALLAVALGLFIGSYVPSKRQLPVWGLVFILLLVIPALFYMEPNLKAGIRAFLTWFPSAALASLFRFACSAGVTSTMLLPNLAIAGGSILLVFGLVNLKVRRADR